MDTAQRSMYRVERRTTYSLKRFQRLTSVVGRFLLVSAFLEDSLRIYTQWDQQLRYLEKYRGFYHGTSHLFLGMNLGLMLIGSVLAITKIQTHLAVIGLFTAVVTQIFGYGLFLEWSFFLRNISMLGGILMLLSEGPNKPKAIFGGLPTVQELDRSPYFALFGRILLVLLFGSFVVTGKMSTLKLVGAGVGLVMSLMVVIGFKAKYSAMMMMTFLFLFNVVMNNWWSINQDPDTRNFVKYNFFQILSIVGGFILLLSTGPGGFSVDEKKKKF
ncbi:SURF4-domain-containing protein [Basidiobolus meristosporus CBS 931.73]|uniref:SURF4-domain-containing protein n=1 Tax=Basidiobolus meristosporus CBS 931.73 TaxID=1314790 RepID=A0A1Y1Z9Y5_9FUNG|nr:SURF4-domain-containing protein [Basidiobolus meristosporus CBS 931.73]|eukprot:ORY06605.1 SURF4-domain-containing protein [Basidiobolus meristosporus CBS 931.73]